MAYTVGSKINLMGSSVSGAMTADVAFDFHDCLGEPARRGSVSAVWSGATSPVGILKIQGSDDDVLDPTKITNVDDISGLSVSITAGSGEQTLILEDVALSYRWLRAYYVFTSGGTNGLFTACRMILKP